MVIIHNYQAVWTPTIGEMLLLKVELTNPYEHHVLKNLSQLVLTYGTMFCKHSCCQQLMTVQLFPLMPDLLRQPQSCDLY